jgi:hypothetical protein
MYCSSSVPINMRFHGSSNPGYMRHGSIRKYSIENACFPTRANSRRVCAWADQFCAGECDGIEMRVRNDVRCSVAAPRVSVARFDTSEPRPCRALATSSRGRFCWKIATIMRHFINVGTLVRLLL